MVSPWQLLGVEPGSDRKTIKRAYTRLLKDVHPEEKPDEFMQLRQAYEWALSTLDAPQQPMVFRVEQPVAETSGAFEWGEEEADQPSAATATIEDLHHDVAPDAEPRPATIHDPWTDSGPESSDPETAPETPSPRLVEDEQDARLERLNRLVSAMAQLLDDPDRRNDPDRWEPLLTAPELNDFQASSAVGGWLLPQVIRLLQSGQEECPLDSKVLIRLDERFQWSTDSSGPLPVIDDQLLRVCLLIEAARESVAQPRARMGWDWLANTLFRLSGRLSRVECLVGLGIASGTLALAALVSVLVPFQGRAGLFTVALMLLMAYSLFSIVVKRVQDAGIHPLLAIVVGVIFPGSWLFFLVAAPKESDPSSDPRLNYSDALDRTYREYYVASGKRALETRLKERIAGIHPGIYLVLVGVWAGTGLLLSW